MALPTQVTGHMVTAAEWNDVIDALNSLHVPGGVLRFLRTNLSATAVEFSSYALPDALGSALQMLRVNAAGTSTEFATFYAEGIWTPFIGGVGGQSGQAYVTQVGRYIKLGRLVTVWGRITLSTLGTITGGVQIVNLPFTTESPAGLYGTMEVPYFVGMTTNWTGLGGIINPSSTAILVYGNTGATTQVTALGQADLSNSTDWIFSAKYFSLT